MSAKVDPKMLLEIPTSIKHLVRLITRTFYTAEDSLVIDLLVRHPCLKEDDICELLKFEKKQLRARIATLRSEKMMQMRLKMETGPDNKAQKVNYYYINYKTMVNVVRYRLDMMRKRLETVERDATSRASFRCTNCSKTFTDLEADLLFNMSTQDFRCTFCGSIVEEDSSALPKKDCRLMIARLNETLEPFYDLMRDVENVTLAPELCEPEPIDINTIRGLAKPAVARSDGKLWSGEASRNQGFLVEETRIGISINDGDVAEAPKRKERPIWMTESTIYSEETAASRSNANSGNSGSMTNSTISGSGTGSNRNRKESEDIMALLLQYEKPSQKSSVKNLIKNEHNSSDDSSDEMDGQDIDNIEIPKLDARKTENINDNSDADDEPNMPIVYVAGNPYAIDKINPDLVDQMSNQEKETYIHVFQENFSYLYD